MSGFDGAAGGAVVEWLLLRAGSRLLLKPQADATGLAPKQAADRHDPLASPSEGLVFVNSAIPACCAWSCGPASTSADCVFVAGIALVKSRSRAPGRRQRDVRRASLVGVPNGILVGRRTLGRVWRIGRTGSASSCRLPHRGTLFQIEVLHPAAAPPPGRWTGSLLGRRGGGLRLRRCALQ